MSYNWTDLSYKEHLIFLNDESLFLHKKKAFIDISRINNEMKSLHAKLKLLKEGEELQLTADKLLKLDNDKADLWIIIDQFDDKKTF